MSLSRVFIRQMIRELYDEKRDGIHVSDLISLSVCPRKFWLDKHDPMPLDIENMLRIWQGKKLHDIVLGNPEYHEYEIEYDGIKGKIDDYIPGLGILIDKKYVSYLPKDQKEVEKYYSHYIIQLKLYSFMMSMLGLRVKEACLLFINLNEKQPFREYIFEPDLSEGQEIFQSLRAEAERVLNGPIPGISEEFKPDDYPCSHCRYRSKCYYLDATGVKNAENV